jgi:hypothetical protein
MNGRFLLSKYILSARVHISLLLCISWSLQHSRREPAEICDRPSVARSMVNSYGINNTTPLRYMI